MLTFLIVLLPILISGILILRKTTSLNRIELILPIGIILGLAIFTFILNMMAFLIKGAFGIITAYTITICLGLFLNKFIESKNSHLELPRGRTLILWIISILGWSGLIFWKAAHALIGSDTNLYYSIARSFVRGNFPPLTPWQPDLPLAYHLGTSELLGAFYLLGGLNFQFLHLFFSALFITCSVQIIVWIWVRHKDLPQFIFANLAGLATFVSFGFFYLALPSFSISLPYINSINELIIKLRNLPTVNQAIEVYGAPINLDALIYFIFHAFGIAIFLSVVVLLINYRKENQLVTWGVLSITLSTLALVNESILVATVPATIAGIFLAEKNNGTLRKNIMSLAVLGVLTSIIILFQGGIINSAISLPTGVEKSIVAFPSKEDIKENFTEYHYYQEISKMLPNQDEWLSLYWFHVGVDILLVVNILILVKLKVNFRQFVLLFSLFIAGLTSLIAYNVLVPKFLVANGNRFLSFSFLVFSLVVCLALIQIVNNLSKIALFKKFLLYCFILWLFIPTVVSPLALLSKTRFGENMLKPTFQQSTSGIKWIKDNLPQNSRVVVLDSRAPHPSGMARVLVEAGVFAPIFPGEFRAYTIEASPQYLDIAYFLSPAALKKLKVDTLLIDNVFFETLLDKRKQQLESDEYFVKVFDNSKDTTEWERIYKVKNEYINKGGEMEGTFEQLTKIFPKNGKIYIDNEENFTPAYIRRAIIFGLKEHDLYYLPQSGVYLNVEANINQKNPDENVEYDYLVLGENTNPKDKCSCKAEIVWKGLNSQVVLWRLEYFGKVEK